MPHIATTAELGDHPILAATPAADNNFAFLQQAEPVAPPAGTSRCHSGSHEATRDKKTRIGSERPAGRLGLLEELTLEVRRLRNTVEYCNLSEEYAKAQSRAMSYCCLLWRDISCYFSLPYTSASTH